MEFEKNKPTTAQDIALADAQKVTLSPLHSEVAPEPLSTTYAHQGDGNFGFERESTASTSDSESKHPHRSLAAAIAIYVSAVFAGITFYLSFLR